MADYHKNGVSIKRLTKGKLPCLPFVSLKEKILGKKYELSIVFATPKLSRELNKRFRGKNNPTNILSFPLSKSSGEIVISLSRVKQDAKLFGKSYAAFLGFLFIHGMLHLKGFEHGSKMSRKEEALSKKFGF